MESTFPSGVKQWTMAANIWDLAKRPELADMSRRVIDALEECGIYVLLAVDSYDAQLWARTRKVEHIFIGSSTDLWQLSSHNKYVVVRLDSWSKVSPTEVEAVESYIATTSCVDPAEAARCRGVLLKLSVATV